MANPEHFEMINQDVETWNEWREENPDIRPDLSEVNLIIPTLSMADLTDVNFYGTDLTGVDFQGADLEGANLEKTNLLTAVFDDANLQRVNFTNANLRHVDFIGSNLELANFFMADLKSADLSRSTLISANFFNANLTLANFRWARLHGVNFTRAILIRANFEDAILKSTVFSENDLSRARGLEKSVSLGASTIDQQTLIRSKSLPEKFLRDCGFSDSFIENIPNLLGTLELAQKHTCFISHSEKDAGLAQKIHDDLQGKGVRCWLTPKNDKERNWYENICDKAVRDNEKFLVLVSEDSIKSKWLRQEIENALKREKRMNLEMREELKDQCKYNFDDFQKPKYLFPILMDELGKEAFESWLKELDLEGDLIDFCDWEKQETYQKSLAGLVEGLQIEYPIGNFDQN
jgi:uncharacterized protein YjbI with pentapeptide repeats